MLLKRSQNCKLPRSKGKKLQFNLLSANCKVSSLPHICSAVTEANAAEALTETPKVCLDIRG